MIAGALRRHDGAGWRGEACAIPQVVHVTWKSDQIQSVFADYLHSWLRLNTGWTLRLHTDADNRRLVQERYPQLLDQFDRYGSNIQRADMIRYVILYEFGGIYADLDFECLRPLAPLLRGRSLVLADEPAEIPLEIQAVWVDILIVVVCLRRSSPCCCRAQAAQDDDVDARCEQHIWLSLFLIF